MKIEHFDSTISVHALLVLLFSDLSAWYKWKVPLVSDSFLLNTFLSWIDIPGLFSLDARSCKSYFNQFLNATVTTTPLTVRARFI